MRMYNTDYLNFLFEVEGEWPIFIALENDDDVCFKLAEAREKAAEIYEVDEDELSYEGCFTDDEAEIYGYDTF